MTGGMMFKGTPGPWVAKWKQPKTETYHLREFYIDKTEGYSQIATVQASVNPMSDWYARADQLEANARLIAAAPDLLEALIRLEKATRILPPHFDEKDSPFYQARAAITKALGEQK